MTFQNARHEETIDNIVERLSRKSNAFLGKHIKYTNEKGRVIGEMDVCRVNYRNGLTYITYYEVKTGKCGRYKARQQAKHFFNTHSEPYHRPTFIYYNIRGSCERWKPK